MCEWLDDQFEVAGLPDRTTRNTLFLSLQYLILLYTTPTLKWKNGRIEILPAHAKRLFFSHFKNQFYIQKQNRENDIYNKVTNNERLIHTMVYNVGGGNKSKGLARKFVVQSQSNGNSKTVRVVKEEGEQYAVVQKHLGNCMCTVMCSDGYKRLCIIRKKFTGRRKTDNNISSGSVVLVGLHDYSTSSEPSKSAGELKRCDLLYVYGEQEKEKLRKVCDLSKLSSGLDDNNGKPQSSSQSVSVPLDSTGDGIQFITSGTGIFNKYAKDESRRKGVVEFGKSGDSGVGTPGTNVISG